MNKNLTVKFLDPAQPCRVCKLPCVTSRAGGSIPIHLGCDTKHALADPATVEQLVAAITLVANTPGLGPVRVLRDPPLPTWHSSEVGPCARCHRPMRRYGTWSTGTLCPRCREA